MQARRKTPRKLRRSSVRNAKQRQTAKRRFRPGKAHRTPDSNRCLPFDAPEIWHEPDDSDHIRIVAQSPGHGFVHPVTVEEVRDRILELPARFRQNVCSVQLSRMTRKRLLFPCYGLQWGPNVYLYPIEESLIERFVRPPRPYQQVEARMYGAEWIQEGEFWELHWTADSIRDYYLNNVLIHEIGHVNDQRNTNSEKRERYANWFADEFGYRHSRSRR